MTNIQLICTGGSVTAQVHGTITAGMIGIPVEIRLDDAWDGLTPRLIVSCDHVTKTAAIDSRGYAAIPWECLIYAAQLKLGVDGWDSGGTMRIPTAWASCGTVKASVANALEESPLPTPPEVMQITALAQNAERIARSLREDADAGKFTPKKGVDYFDGAVGPKGDPGVQGIQGIPGIQGVQGEPGRSPYIGPNGNWFAYSEQEQAYFDTGVSTDVPAEVNNRIRKFYTSNTGSAHLADSDDGLIRNLEIRGNSVQRTSTGANSCDKFEERTAAAAYGLAYKVAGGVVTAKGTTTNQVDINIKSDLQMTAGQTIYWKFYDGVPQGVQLRLPGAANITSWEASGSTVLKSSGSIPFLFRVAQGVTLNGSWRVMISIDTPCPDRWEDYTGGQPSPSPSFPQPIHSIEEIHVRIAGYGPYADQSRTILPPFPLRGIGDIKDVCDVEKGVWKQNIGMETGENITSREANGTFGRLSCAALPALDSGIPVLCNKLRGVSFDGRYSLYPIYPETNRNTWTVAFKTSGMPESITDEFTADLVRGIRILYARNAAEEIAVDADDLAFLRGLKAHYPQTDVSITDQDGNDISAHFLYPCSLEGFVECVKRQMGDDRAFVYNLGSRVSDADYAAAAAYVNSEYAAVLAEINMM